MKTIIFILVFYFLSISTTFALTDAQVVTRINNVQGSVPGGIPAAPTNMDQKGYIGEILANIFDVNEKIKSQFISAFQSIYNTGINTLPRWNGQSFVEGSIIDDGTRIGIGAGTSDTMRVNIGGNINISGNYYRDGILFVPTLPTDVVRTFGDQDVGGIKTFLSAMVFESSAPVINFIDRDTNAQGYITTNSAFGSIAIVADTNNTVAGSKISFSIDTAANTPKMIINENGYVGIGLNNPTESLDVIGKIRMRGQTEVTDTPDTLATKKYVDEKLVKEADKLAGYREVAINVEEDTYGTTQVVGRGGADTCNTDVSLPYYCVATEEKNCRDLFITYTERRGSDGDVYRDAVYNSKPVICSRSWYLIRSEDNTNGIKNTSGTLQITSRDYSGWKESCTVRLSITGNPSCSENRTFRLGSGGSDAECKENVEASLKNGGICINIKGISMANWNISNSTISLEYYGF